jgi:N utilization substance protein A
MGVVIGKNRSNLDLTESITGFKINLLTDETFEEDVDLSEFSDEIDQWIIDVFVSCGYKTAKQVLKDDIKIIESITDLEVETIEEVLNILNAEFD